jgi:PAS domain S-box-containing protein
MTNVADPGVDGERVMAASMEAVAVVDETTFVSVNEPCADLYGFDSSGELAGEPWRPRLCEADRDRFERTCLSACRREGRWRGELTGRRRDESTFRQEASLVRADERRFVWAARGRTDRPDRELDRYETIVETVDDGVYALDEDLRITFLNDALCEILGRSREEVLGTRATDFLVGDERQAVDELRQRVLEGDSDTGTFEVTGAGPDGDRTYEVHYRLSPEPDERFRGSVGVVRDVTARKEREAALRRERAFVENALDALKDVFYLVDDDRILRWSSGLETVTGYAPEEIEQLDPADLLAGDPPTHASPFRDGGDGPIVADVVTRDGARVPHEFRSTTWTDDVTGETYRCGVARDVRDRLQRERQLERQRDELETLNRINELLLQVTQDLLESSTREALERSVCEHLAESELYQFAWIGELDAAGRRITPRTSAGIDDGYVETVTITTDGETGRGPGGRALRTGEVQVAQDVRTDPTFEPWREAVLDRGVESAAAVPLTHGDTTYGLLAVYATRPLAFSRREQAGFETLGKAVGFAVNALENRDLLFADTVVEVEFEVSDARLVFVRASAQLDCELTVTGYVASETDRWSVYLRVAGTSPAALREAVADDPDVERVRAITDEGDEGLVEFVMSGPALNEITAHGAVLTTGHVDAGRGRFTVEAPRSTDTRRLVDRLQAAYPDSTVVAKREFDRSVQRAGELRQSVADRLTDRQREALFRAYHAGYFEWPRRSTAADVAESMGVAETTFHYHFRRALSKLLAELTGRESGRSS